MSESQIKALITKRAGSKTSLIAFTNFLSKFNSETDISSLEKRFKDIESVRERFSSYLEELEGLLEESDELFDYRTTFDDAYFSAMGTAINLLSQHCKNYITPVISPQTAGNTQMAHINQADPTSSFNNPASSASQDSETLSARSHHSNELPQLTNSQSWHNMNPQLSLSQLSHNALENAYSSSLPSISLPTFDGSFDRWLGFVESP